MRFVFIVLTPVSGARLEKLVSIIRFSLSVLICCNPVSFFVLFSGFVYFDFSESFVRVTNKLNTLQRISEIVLLPLLRSGQEFPTPR